MRRWAAAVAFCTYTGIFLEASRAALGYWLEDETMYRWWGPHVTAIAPQTVAMIQGLAIAGLLVMVWVNARGDAGSRSTGSASSS